MQFQESMKVGVQYICITSRGSGSMVQKMFEIFCAHERASGAI